jgi:hypothetical protein
MLPDQVIKLRDHGMVRSAAVPLSAVIVPLGVTSGPSVLGLQGPSSAEAAWSASGTSLT